MFWEMKAQSDVRQAKHKPQEVSIYCNGGLIPVSYLMPIVSLADQARIEEGCILGEWQ